MAGSLLFYCCYTGAGAGGSPVFVIVDNELKLVAAHKGRTIDDKAKMGCCMWSFHNHAHCGKIKYSKFLMFCAWHYNC